MRKGIAYKPASRTESPSYLGIALVFAGAVCLAVAKALMVFKFRNLTAVVSFIGGVLLLSLGLTVAKRHRKR